jgi:hypothetical protein
MTLQQEQNVKCMIGRQGNVNVSGLATVLALSAPLSKQTIQFFCLIPLPPILSPVHEPHPLFQMGWLQSLLSPLKKLWFRLHSTPKKSMFFAPITAFPCCLLCVLVSARFFFVILIIVLGLLENDQATSYHWHRTFFMANLCSNYSFSSNIRASFSWHFLFSLF